MNGYTRTFGLRPLGQVLGGNASAPELRGFEEVACNEGCESVQDLWSDEGDEEMHSTLGLPEDFMEVDETQWDNGSDNEPSTVFYDNESCDDNIGIESDNEVRLEPLIEEEEDNVDVP